MIVHDRPESLNKTVPHKCIQHTQLGTRFQIVAKKRTSNCGGTCAVTYSTNRLFRGWPHTHDPSPSSARDYFTDVCLMRINRCDLLGTQGDSTDLGHSGQEEGAKL